MTKVFFDSIEEIKFKEDADEKMRKKFYKNIEPIVPEPLEYHKTANEIRKTLGLGPFNYSNYHKNLGKTGKEEDMFTAVNPSKIETIFENAKVTLCNSTDPFEEGKIDISMPMSRRNMSLMTGIANADDYKFADGRCCTESRCYIDVNPHGKIPNTFKMMYMKQMNQKAFEDGQQSVLDDLMVEDVIFNPPATIVFWGDGTKTVVKCHDTTEFSPYFGFCAALAKKIYGTNSAVNRIVSKYEKKMPQPTRRIWDSPMRWCLDCKYSSEPGYGEHCKGCAGTIEHPNFEAPTKSEWKLCSECTNRFEPPEGEHCAPCIEGHNHPNFEKVNQEKAEHHAKLCTNCKHRYTNFREEPCIGCLVDSKKRKNWEYSEEMERCTKKDPTITGVDYVNLLRGMFNGVFESLGKKSDKQDHGRCSKCKNWDNDSNKEPCKSCKHILHLFETNPIPLSQMKDNWEARKEKEEDKE